MPILRLFSSPSQSPSGMYRFLPSQVFAQVKLAIDKAVAVFRACFHRKQGKNSASQEIRFFHLLFSYFAFFPFACFSFLSFSGKQPKEVVIEKGFKIINLAPSCYALDISFSLGSLGPSRVWHKPFAWPIDKGSPKDRRADDHLPMKMNNITPLN